MSAIFILTRYNDLIPILNNLYRTFDENSSVVYPQLFAQLYLLDRNEQ